jgi:hypothetical protein
MRMMAVVALHAQFSRLDAHSVMLSHARHMHRSQAEDSGVEIIASAPCDLS